MRHTLLLAALCACSSPPTESAERHDPHEGSIAEGVDCANCHTPDGWRIGGSGARAAGGGFDHDTTGFPLTGRHVAVGCVDCHRPGEPVRRACVSCHADPHEARLGTRCDECHSSRDFHLTDAMELHRRTQLPLTGMHALADCTECHQRQGDAFVRNAPSDCYGCHAADYARPDIHPSHLGDATTPPFPRDCEQCHRPLGWVPALVPIDTLGSIAGGLTSGTTRFDADAHDLAFPIRFGPHRGAECESCHRVPAMPRVVSCTGCHEHGPLALAQQHPGLAVGTEGPGCLACHPGGATR
ncbi:MAG: hypothetical protein R3B99_33835 [Polyangiales bacterium]